MKSLILIFNFLAIKNLANFISKADFFNIFSLISWQEKNTKIFLLCILYLIQQPSYVGAHELLITPNPSSTVRSDYFSRSHVNKESIKKNALTNALPVIITQPMATSVIGGQDTSFSVTATSGENGNLTYQWQISNDEGSTFSNINNDGIYSGSTSSNLAISNVPVSLNGKQYRVQIDNNDSQIFSNAVGLTVNTPAFDNTPLWQTLGTEGFSAGQAYPVCLAVDSFGTPYVSYSDSKYGSKVTVKKFNGTTWEYVGLPGISDSDAIYTSLVLNNNGTPYVAYKDNANQGKVTVMKFDGKFWIPIGKAGFSAPAAENISLVLDSSGIPYIAYSDSNNGYKATVMKFNGKDWVVLGEAGFSDDSATSIKLAVSASGTPYVLYTDGYMQYKATAMKFNGVSWEKVGEAGFSDDSASYLTLVLDNNGTPYAGFSDGSRDSRTTVMMFNGLAWKTVGTAGFSSASSDQPNISLLLDNSGIPFVSFSDSNYPLNRQKITVLRFNGTDWETVGKPGISTHGGYYSFLAKDSYGILYLAYYDYDVDEGDDSKLVVKKFVTSVYPVINSQPVNTVVTSGEATSFTVSASTENGNLVYQWQISRGPLTEPFINVSDGGIYSGSNSATLKITGVPVSLHRQYFRVQISRANVSNGGFVKSNAVYLAVILPAFDSTRTWQSTSSKAISLSKATNTAIVSDSSGMLFLSYADAANDNRAIVKKFSGETWEDAGLPDISAGAVNYTTLALSNSGIPYLAYLEKNEGKLTVTKFDGTSWVTVGTQAFAKVSINVSLILNNTGIPFVAYQDADNNSKATVKKFNGSEWETVGTTGFSAGAAGSIDIALNSYGIPYVVFWDAGRNSKVTIMKFNSVTWEIISDSYLPGGYSGYPSLVLDKSDKLYLGFYNYSRGSANKWITVAEFNGTDWYILGIAGIGPATDNFSLILDSYGTPFVAYKNVYNNNRATVTRFNGLDEQGYYNWKEVGTPGISTGEANFISMVMDKSGTPYLAFQDNGNDGKVTVMKFTANTLPVTWIFFNGKSSIEGNVLNWSTASEINAESFKVERSLTGRDFSKIGQIAAFGNTNLMQNYRFTDYKLPLGITTLYYRIKQLDTDGKYSYTRIISISSDGKLNTQTLSVSPNPFIINSSLTLRFNHTLTEKNGKVWLVSMYGRELYRCNIFSPLGSGEIVLDDLPQLAPGIYLMNVVLDGNLTVHKVIVE